MTPTSPVEAVAVVDVSDPAALTRRAFCCCFLVALLLTNHSRSRFYAIATRYRAAVDPPSTTFGWFDSLSNIDPPGLLPLFGGWPTLSIPTYARLTRSLALEMAVLAAGCAPPGAPAAVALAATLLLYLLLFGQRIFLKHGLVSGHKQCLLFPSLLLLLLQELPGVASAADEGVAVLASSYAYTGATKLLLPRLYSGVGWLAWLDGRTLRAQFFERAALTGNRWALRLAQRPRLCAVASAAAVALELSWAALPLLPRRGGAATAFCALHAAATLCFHLGVLGLMAVNFFPFWAPALCWLLPALLGAPPPPPPAAGRAWAASGVVALHLAGIAAGFALALRRRATTAAAALWPLGVSALYSSYVAGYQASAAGDVEVAAVALFVTPRGAGDDAERLWRPPVDAHFSRRVNSECKLRGGAAAAAAANLALLALSEDARAAEPPFGPRGREATLWAQRVAAALCRKYARVRWVERRVTFRRDGGCEVALAELLTLSQEAECPPSPRAGARRSSSPSGATAAAGGALHRAVVEALAGNKEE